MQPNDIREDMADDAARRQQSDLLERIRAAQAAAQEESAPAQAEQASQTPDAERGAPTGVWAGIPQLRSDLRQSDLPAQIGGAALETPAAIWHGAAEAVNETLDLIDEVGVQGGLLVGRAMGGDQVTADAVRQALESNPDFAASISGTGGIRVPEGSEPDTVGGQLIESVAQFITGFVGAGKVTRAAGVLQGAGRGTRVAREFVNGAIADFAAFDGQEDRLSNLVQMVPELQNPVTEYLAADEDDPEIEGRLKNAIEGGPLGLATDAVFAGIRALGRVRRAQRAVGEIQRVEADLDAAAAETIERDILRVGGDPSGPAMMPAAGPDRMRGNVIENMGEMARGGDVTPELAAGMVETAERWAAAVRHVQPGAARTVDDIAAEYAQRGDPAVVQRLVAMMDEARTDLPEPVSLTQWVRSRGGLLDEAGELSGADLDRRINAFTRNADREALDDAALAAWEAGYIGSRDGARPTIREFLDALDADARAIADGNGQSRVYSEADYETVDLWRARQQLVEDLDELELDFTRRTAEERQGLARASAAETDAQVGTTRTEADLLSLDEAMEAAGARTGIAMPDAAKLGANDVRINFNALNTGDDIRSIIGQMADRFKGDIDAARGEVRGNQVLFDEASELGSAWRALEERGANQALKDSEVVAAQRLYIASAENVRRAANAALENADSDMAQFQLRRAMAVHRAVQAEIAGAKAAAGRALRAWQVVTGTTAQARGEMRSILDTFGGRLDQRDISRLAAMTAEELDRSSRYMSFREAAATVGGDILRFAWLSGPHTHIMNMAGNSLTTVYDTLPRLAAGVKGKILGDPELERQLGAALAQYAGLGAGLRAQFKAFARSADYERMGRRIGQAVQDTLGNRRSLREGLQESAAAVWEDNPVASTFRGRFDDMGVSGRKYEDGMSRGVSAERFGVRQGSGLGDFLDGVGNVLSAPTDFLGWQDDFFKGINELAERHALAYEAAARELDDGVIDQASFRQRYADLVETPTQQIREGARLAAQRRTFTEPVGTVTRNLMGIRRSMNAVTGLPFGHVLLPFIVTPSNILKFAFQSSPFGFLFREMQEELAAGGARRAMAQARMMAGTGLLFTGMDMAANGEITGAAPKDPGAREQWERLGVQEYSIRVGDRWVSYRRMEPVSTMLAIGADLSAIAHNTAMDDSGNADLAEVLGPALGAAIQTVTNKTYLTSMAEFIQFAEDPQRYGPNYLQRFVSSVSVPAGVAQVERVIDPEMRSAHDFVTATLARVPGYSEDLPQSYDLWGRPRIAQSGIGRTYDALSPFTIRTLDPEPIDRELYRIGHYPRRPAPRVSVPFNGQNVSVNLRNSPEIYERYVQLAGNDLRLAHGMGARDYLNAVVEGRVPEARSYQQMADSPAAGQSKADFINTVIDRYRMAARQALFQEHGAELEDLARRELMAQARAFGTRQAGDSLIDLTE